MQTSTLQTDPVDLEGFRSEMRQADVATGVPATLDAYHQQVLELYERLETAVTTGDPATIARTAHDMKSAAYAIRAVFLAEILLELEAAGMRESLAVARALLDLVSDECAAVLCYLERAAKRTYPS